jgi:DNA repair protein RadA/Sms
LHFRCLVCDATFEEVSPVCGNCGNVQTLYSDEDFVEPHTEPERAKPARRPAVQATKIAPRAIDFLSTGNAAWDEALGGGVVRGSSILVHGAKGTGKSRALSRIAVTVAQKLGGVALYGSAEMPRDLLVSYMKQEGLGPAELERLYVADDGSLESLLSDAAELGPAVVVLDSVQKFAFEGARGESALRRTIEEGIELSTRRATRGRRAVVFFISQVTKENLFAGPAEFGHDVDVLLSLRRDEQNLYVECADKNRFARTPRIGIEALERSPVRVDPKRDVGRTQPEPDEKGKPSTSVQAMTR